LNKQIIITSSPEETRQYAKNLVGNLSLPVIITLTGDLGSGKTTFVQGLAEGLGIEKKVNSPTFLIIKKYEGDRTLYHADLYRLSSEKEVAGTGLLEILNEKNSIVVIEWAEKMGKYLPEKRIDIQFKYVDENKREIIIMNFQDSISNFQ